eukprot:TRINITY_DN2361_c0_g1_i4.p1 TRINITY_DN2361_c0_g1~~TRINITY_DN2361_c0_g1_i4.p1  ORF type:complete len:125 (+),score=21.04 TRINITY_DN2361_c0_g1_i4:259-633(+)
MKYLIAQGAALNSRRRSGITPLMQAALGNKLDAVRVLVEAGAELDLDNAGATAKDIAARNGYSEIVQYLALASHLRRCVFSLRQLCVVKLSRDEGLTVELARLPLHVAEEVRAARQCLLKQSDA